MSAPAGTNIVIGPPPPGFERWDELLALILDSFAYMDDVIDPPSSAHRLTPQGLKEKATEERLFLAWQGDNLAGCAFVAERPDCFYVGKLAVAPSAQGKGIGARLIAAAEDAARAAGKPMLELQTRVELSGNHAVFARLGFTETARSAHAGYDRPTSITMRKAL